MSYSLNSQENEIQPIYWHRGLTGGGRYSGNQRQQFAQAGQEAIKSVAGIMQQRKNDQIAQALLQRDAGPDVAQRYQGMGLRPTDAYKQFLSDRKNQQDATDREQQSRFTEGKIANLYKDTPAEQTVPTMVNGQQYNVPLSQYLTHIDNRTNNQQFNNKTPVGRLNAKLDQFGLNADDLAQIDKAPAGTTTFQNENGDQVSTEQANQDPKNHYAVGTISGDEGDKQYKIPYHEWQGIIPRFRNLQVGSQPVQSYANATTGSTAQSYAPDMPNMPEAPNTSANQVKTKEDYDALPSGSTYIAPDGTMRQKP